MMGTLGMNMKTNMSLLIRMKSPLSFNKNYLFNYES